MSISNTRKKLVEDYDLIFTSIHESGHVIFGLLHNMKINQVKITQNIKNIRISGLTIYNFPTLKLIKDNELVKYLAHSEIGMNYAGIEAEKILYTKISGSINFLKIFKEGSSNDFSEANKLIKKYNIMPPGIKRYNYKILYKKQISKELELYWDDVTLISHKLFANKYLSFRSLKKLLVTKSDKKDFWEKKFKELYSAYNL